jgi:hypothetical protein
LPEVYAAEGVGNQMISVRLGRCSEEGHLVERILRLVPALTLPEARKSAKSSGLIRLILTTSAKNLHDKPCRNGALYGNLTREVFRTC